MKTTAPCSHAFSGISRKGQTTKNAGGRSAGPSSRTAAPPDESPEPPGHAVSPRGSCIISRNSSGGRDPADHVPLGYTRPNNSCETMKRCQVLAIGLVLGHSCDLQEERHHGSLHLHEEPWVALVAQQHEHLLVVRGEQLARTASRTRAGCAAPRPDDGRRNALELAPAARLQLIEPSRTRSGERTRRTFRGCSRRPWPPLPPSRGRCHRRSTASRTSP